MRNHVRLTDREIDYITERWDRSSYARSIHLFPFDIENAVEAVNDLWDMNVIKHITKHGPPQEMWVDGKLMRWENGSWSTT